MIRARGLAIFWLVMWFGAAILAKLPFSGNPADLEFNLNQALALPALTHPLGFDAFGRDLLQLSLHASATSALFALLTTFIALAGGIIFGAAGALLPYTMKQFARKTLDFFLGFPSLLFALAWAAIRGPGWSTLIFALLLGSLPPVSRLLLLRCEELLQEEFVTAAQSVGASRLRILHTHLLPFLMSLCSLKAPNLFAHALMAEATLSFLGIGAPIGKDTWGALLIQGKDYLLEAPHLVIGAGVPLLLTVLSLLIISEERDHA
ncbi:ABC transporter permease subunit [Bdellovibrionota bacterium FG-2]